MRYILIILFLWGGALLAQPEITRTNGANTVNDPHLMASKSLRLPVYADTSSANVGLDSAGKIIFSKVDTSIYIRGGLTGHLIWKKIAGSTGGGGGLTFVVTDSTLTGHGTSSDSLRANFNRVQKKIIFGTGTIYSGDTLSIDFANAAALGITGSIQYKGSDGKQKGDAQNVWDSTGKILKIGTSGTTNGQILVGNNATGTFKAGGDGFFQGNNITVEALGTGNLIKLRNNGADKIAINENGAISVNGLGNYGSNGQILTSQGSGSPAIWTSKDTVAHDLTLFGQGNTGSPLGIDTINYIATKKNLKDSIASVKTIAANKLTQGGDSFGSTYQAGTTDNNPVAFLVNNVERARIAITSGALLINQTTDNTTDKLQVNGSLIASTIRSSFSGIGSGAATHIQLRRTEGGQTWGLDIATSGDGTSTRSLTLLPINASSGGLSISGATTFSGQIYTNSNIVNSSTGEYQMSGTNPFILRNLGAVGRGLGFDFYANFTAQGRPTPSSIPVMRIDNEGRVRTGGDGTTNWNYGSALDVVSSYGAFTPPRLTTAQRDTINGVQEIIMTAFGSGYTSTPTVAITGGGGSGATAIANIAGNIVLSITVTSKGIGYTSTPTVSITGGGGSGATAVAHQGTLEAGMMIYNKTTNKHQGYNGTNWYDFEPDGIHYTVSTTNATPTTIATIAIPTGKTVEYLFTIAGKDGSNNQVILNRVFRAVNISGTVTLYSLAGTGIADFNSVALTGSQVNASASGSNVVIQAQGLAATNISWDLFQISTRTFF